MKLVLCRGPPDMATIGFLGDSGKVEIWACTSTKKGSGRQAAGGISAKKCIYIYLGRWWAHNAAINHLNHEITTRGRGLLCLHRHTTTRSKVLRPSILTPD
jgi:hypothetical protein